MRIVRTRAKAPGAIQYHSLRPPGSLRRSTNPLAAAWQALMERGGRFALTWSQEAVWIPIVSDSA
ncbi:MAG: hypothetical protein IH921_09695 [Gemmatimonadetes bacterium]|nr:hypothetical protein [Gemmatimonadota bacterium]